jgi:hypothetical protein
MIQNSIAQDAFQKHLPKNFKRKEFYALLKIMQLFKTFF